MTACSNCGRPIRPTYDPDVPWVHLGSHNGFCDVTDTASAVGSAWANWTELTGTRPLAPPSPWKENTTMTASATDT